MTTNNFFQSGFGPGSPSEQNLVEDNIIEMIQLAGQDMFYIPRVTFAEDAFYGEAPNSKFTDYSVIEMYILNTADYGGSGDTMSKFGLQLTDSIDLLVSKKRFQQESGLYIPNEGDLIYFPLVHYLFQIDFVEDQPGTIGNVQQFYQLGKLYTYAFQCSVYQFSHEKFDTGIAQIDNDFNLDTFVDLFDNSAGINAEAEEDLDVTEENIFGKTIT